MPGKKPWEGNLTHNPFENLSKKTGNIIINNKNEKREDNVQSEFEEVLKNRFVRILPGCCFESKIPGINRIAIGTTEDEDSVPVMVYYNKEDKSGKQAERVASFTLTNDGELLMALPPELRSVKKEEILHELLGNLRDIDLDRCIPITDDGIPLEILPPGDWESGTKVSNSEETEQRRRDASIDMDRFRVFSRHPKFLAVFGPTKLTRIRCSREQESNSDTLRAGLSDYHAFLFPKGVVFENATCENRIYYYSFEPELSSEQIQKLQKSQMNSDELKNLLDHIKFHVERKKNKNVLRQEGKRFHRNHPDKDAPSHIKDNFKDEVWDFIDNQLVA